MAVAYPIESDKHALTTGVIMGALMKAGLDIRPTYDDEGNYTAALEVAIDIGGDVEPVRAVVVVLP